MASLMSNSSFGKIPSGTTANRPATPAVGDQYYNGTLGYLEIYTSSGWKPAGGIPSGNTAGRPSSPSTGQPYFNGELQRLELYTGAQYGWQNIVAETPGVTGYTGSVLETNTTNTIVLTGTNFASGATAVLVGSDGTEYTAITTTVNNLTSITATFGVISAALEPYDIKVTNPSNLYGVYYDILTVNDKPVWQTSAGSLGTDKTSENVSIQLAASDEENNSLTYALVSGSLPTGLTLSSSGLISGTASGLTSQTFNFTISVSDGINTAQNRAFSLAYNSVPVITGGALTSDSTYYYRTFTGNGTLSISNISASMDIITIAGGGGSSEHSSVDGGGGGAGAGGLLYSAALSMPVASYNIVIGGGGGNRSNGTNTTLSGGSISLTAIGGGAGGSYSNFNATSGGSGGGQAGAMTTSLASGTPGQGNPGGYGGQGSPAYGGGGGGGAGAAGGSTATDAPGVGGVGSADYSSWGLATSTGQNVSGVYYYAGGGGGGTRSSNYAGAFSGGVGGYGGGGTGAGNQNSNTPTNGSTNTGGGAGGSSRTPNITASGGSGIVIVRYTKASVGG